MRQPTAPDDRGVSEVIGYVLVVSLVISTVGIVSVSGLSVLQDARQAEQIENAQRAFDLLADNVEDIYREGAPSRSTEIQLGDAQVIARETTYLNVTWRNSTGADQFRNTTFTSITYRGDGDQRLVYDGGAVFRLSSPDGAGVAVRDPPFVVRDEQVVLPLVRPVSSATTSVSGSTALIRTGRLSQSTLTRGTQYSDIWINVTAPHWRAWQDALDDRSNVDCTAVPSDNRVDCELIGGNSPDVFSLTETLIRVDLTR